MTERDHPLDAIADLVSGRLGADERVDVEAHLKGCAACSSERERLLRNRQRLASIEDPVAVADELDDIGAAEEDPAGGWMSAIFTRPVLAFGVPLIMLAVVTIGLRVQTPSLPKAVASDYREFKAAELHLDMETKDGALLGEFLEHRGIQFQARVLDLSMMEYSLEGGRVHTLNQLPAAAFVYRGPTDEYLLCQMYPGTIEGLPPGATVREHDGIRVYVYTQGSLTMAFWQEGDVIGVLVSDIPSEDLAQMAFANAREGQAHKGHG